jgi:hypothetical protein
MTMNSLMIKLIAGTVALSISAAAQATLLTYEFAGSVFTILSDDSSNTFSANFAVNDVVTGSYTLDTTATEQAFNSTIHYYDASFTVTIGAHTFSGPAQHRVFNDDSGEDGFSIINEQGTYTGPALGPLEPSTFFIQYLGMPMSTLSNFDQITDPESLIPLATFVLHGFRLDSTSDDSFGGLYFTIDSLQQTTPEPGSIVLLGLGLAGIGYSRRRRSLTSPTRS